MQPILIVMLMLMSTITMLMLLIILLLLLLLLIIMIMIMIALVIIIIMIIILLLIMIVGRRANLGARCRGSSSSLGEMFVYLSKKIAIPHNLALQVVAWNSSQDVYI